MIQVKAMLEDYASGMTIRQVAANHAMSVGKVFYVLRDSGCEFRPRGVPIGYRFGPGHSGGRNGIRCTSEQILRMSESQKCHYNGLNGYGHTKPHNHGYVRAYAPDHPRAARDGYVMLHTIIAEIAIGRYLFDNEVVHHINHDRSDNRIENLVVMDKKKHMSMHMRERQGKAGVSYQ